MAQNQLWFQERTVTNAAQTQSIINIPKSWAAVNRKNAVHTDSKGYLKTYICKIEVVSTDMLSYIYTAPEAWYVKNAVRQWHLHRAAKRSERFGDTRGKTTYGETIRPKLVSTHQTTDNTAADYELQVLKSSGALTGGEWKFTQVAHEVAVRDSDNTTGVTAEELSDQYYLCLTGSHVLDSGAHTTAIHNKWTDVSMVASYLQARRNFSVHEHGNNDEFLDFDPNPLNEFRTDSNAGIDAAKIEYDEQQLQPPYQASTPSGDAPGDAIALYQQAVLRTTSQYGRDFAVVRAPGGLLRISSQSQATSGTTDRIPQFNIEVVGVVPTEG